MSDQQEISGFQQSVAPDSPKNKFSRPDDFGWGSFGRPPDDWEIRTVEDLFRVEKQSVDPDSLDDPEVWLYSMPAFDEFGEPILTPPEEIGSQKFEIPNHTLLFPKLNLFQKRFWLVQHNHKRPAIGSTEYWPLIPRSNEVNLEFYHQYFNTDTFINKPRLSRSSSTNSHQRVNSSLFDKARLPVPPLEEQRKIASVLYTVDQAIQETEEIISQRGTVRQGLMQDIFRYGVDSNGELRRSNEDEPYRDTKYGSAPKGWDIEPLDSIVPDDAPVTYGIVKPGDHHPGGVPVVKVENIMEGSIDQEGLLHTDPEIHEQYQRAELNEGDLLFTIRGTVGRMAFVPKELDGGNLTQDTARIRVVGANPRFVRYYLETATPNNYFERHTIGQAVQGINLEDLREVPVHLPSKEEQNRIVEILDSHTSQIQTERNYRDRLQRLKQGLMQDLLSGEVRTQDKDIEIVDEVLAHG